MSKNLNCSEYLFVVPSGAIINYFLIHCFYFVQALCYIERNARELGIRRTKRLNVAGAFHSEAVFAAVMPVRQALRLCDVTDPKIRVMSGVDGKHYRDARHIQSQLPRQVNP